MATVPVPDEVTRQQRLVDQALSIHAALRDRANRVATITTVTLLCASAIGTALAFAGDDTPLQLLGLQATTSTWLGAFSVVVFCGTLSELVTDRRGTARRHDAAVRLLADLKSEYRSAAPDGDASWTTAQGRLRERYDHVMGLVPPIPEARFAGLKARHLRKVELSKLLSAHPGLTVRRARRRLDRRLREVE